MAVKYVGQISRFTGDSAFLSNFYQVAVRYKSYLFPSSEHAYQAGKIPKHLWHKIIKIKSAANAKRAVHAMLNDSARSFAWSQLEWDKKKLDIMREILREKFKNPLLRAMLKDTAPAELIEGNTWNDRFWGVPITNSGELTKTGENWLGKILMEIRDEL